MITTPAYLASAYSHRDPTWTEEQRLAHRQARYEAVRDATAWMLQHKLWVYSPIVHCHDIALTHVMPTDALFWQEFNETFIDRFHSVVVLADSHWRTSRGVQMEIEYTKKRHYPLAYLMPLANRIEPEPEYILLTHEPTN